jgi:lipopolysaccharide/colanic/teichoic acid biosynthesis glycosyltransferase
MKIFNILTTPQSTVFLTGQAAFMKTNDMEMHVVSSTGPELSEFRTREQVATHVVEMKRSISPLSDLAALARMVALFLRERPDIVHAHTPKASLIAMIAARAARIPCRIFHIHGLPHSTATGVTRLLLRWGTKVPALLATRIFCVSRSAAAMAVAEGMCTSKKLTVIGGGSSNGVRASDVFCPESYEKTTRETLLGIPMDALVIGYAGRLVKDKGVADLHRCWTTIREEIPNSYLLIAGEPEARDALPEAVLASLRSDPRVKMLGQCGDMPRFYACLDLFVLPTYREGLPTVILESAAMAVPVVASRCVGCVDAVVDGVTGTLVAAGDHRALTVAIGHYLKNPDLRREHGLNARRRVLRDFRPEDIWQATLEQYRLASALSRRPLHSPSARAAKRTIDITISFLGLTLLFPFLVLLGFLVRLEMGSPVLFRQRRPGLRERPFTMLKFRTMRDDRDPSGTLLSDAERITAFGSFLRRTSLDELPELWNVLKGEMSLAGPRPLLMQYLGRYDDFQRRRHEVRPGVTGWAQIHGRNGLAWEERFRLDVWYVDHQSFLLDLKILYRTLGVVLRGKSTSWEGHATMPEFGLAAKPPKDRA